MSQFRAFACGVIAALALTALVNSPQLPAASPDHGVDARLASIKRLLHAALGDKADIVAFMVTLRTELNTRMVTPQVSCCGLIGSGPRNAAVIAKSPVGFPNRPRRPIGVGMHWRMQRETSHNAPCPRLRPPRPLVPRTNLGKSLCKTTKNTKK